MSPSMFLSLPLLFCCLQFAIVESCLTLNGQTPVFEDNGNSRAQDGFRDQIFAISRDLQFSCYGNVTGWTAYAERDGTFDNVQFQVWRLTPTDMNSNCTAYRLVGSHSFINISTNNRLLNITSLGGRNPIPVQPGDVVGFYGDFGGRFDNVNIQSNSSISSFVSYYSSPVTSAEAASLTVASTCSSLLNIEQGVPVIIARVIVTETTQPTTRAAALPITTVGEIQQTTTELNDTTEMTEQITLSMATTGSVESSSGIELVTTLNEGSMILTKATNESTLEELSTDDAQRTEELSLSTIVILSVVIALVSGVAVVILCFAIGRCVCKRLHQKQRSLDTTSLSLNVPDGNRDHADSHIYCEMGEVFEKKKDRKQSFSDLDNIAAFKQLDCSCKIPHRYPMADYEVPVTTLQRSSGKPYQQGGKEDFENTYETPLDAKMRMSLQGGAVFKDSEERKRLDSTYDVPRSEERGRLDSTYDVPRSEERGRLDSTYDVPRSEERGRLDSTYDVPWSEERKRLDSTYDVPRPVEEEEYTFMAAVPLESGFSEAGDDIYENI